MPVTSVQHSTSDSFSTQKSDIPESATPKRKKQGGISVTFASGETINPEIPAEKTQNTVPASSVQPSTSDSLSEPKGNITESVTPESKKHSSISVTFASGETFTKQTQSIALDDSSDQNENAQQSEKSSDGHISSEADKKANPEITIEKPISTVPTASKQSSVLDGLSTLQSDISANSTPEIMKQESISVTSISEETIIKQTQPTIIDNQIDQASSTQQSINTAHKPIPQETEKSDNYQEKTTVNNQAIANGSPRQRERVKTHAEGRLISEPISDSTDDSDERSSHLSEIGARVALLGGAVAVGGLIAGSTAVTAIGVTAAVVGGTCCLLEGK